uniref:MIR domain-containing protein n=1 Tax=Setaria digitata TaxID=48799 RepID=A0A915PYK0_9BILA
MLSEFVVSSILYFVSVGTSQTDDGYVTCGSVVKLKNNYKDIRLHSHDVKYGSGSGQQSVTAVQAGDDVNSHWQILAAIKGTCKRGEPVKCGSKIRLKHLTTGCYLHSHLFHAPLTSENQEVSCFGNNESDSGDHWIVICNNNVWLRQDTVKFKHEDTGKFLATSGQQYGRPISGQYEVVAISTSQNSALWETAEGIFM